jgi:hypothetical protein
VCNGLITDLAVDEVIALRLLLVLHILGLSLLGLVRPNRVFRDVKGLSREIIDIRIR